MLRKTGAFRASLVVVLILVGLAACEPRGKKKPPADTKENPTLVTVSHTAITVDFMKYALSNLPLMFRRRFMKGEGKSEFLDRQIDAMIFYHEGISRGLDKKQDFSDRIHQMEKVTMIHMAKDAAFSEAAPAGDEELQKQYDHYIKREQRAGREPKSFEEAVPMLRKNLIGSRYRRGYKARVEKLKSEYTLQIMEDTITKPIRELTLEMVVVQSGAFNLSVKNFLEWAGSMPENYRKQLATEIGRKWLVNHYVENELLYLDALQQEMNKSEEFKNRIFVLEVNILGQMTADEIVSTNVEATYTEAEKYFKDNPEKFKGATWEQAQPKARAIAGNEKKDRVTKELAIALARGRYVVERNEDRIEELDLSGVTKGEIGLVAFPPVPPEAEKVDIENFLSGGAETKSAGSAAP